MADEDHKINDDNYIDNNNNNNNNNRRYNNENDNDQILFREYVLDTAIDNDNLTAVDNKCTHNHLLHEQRTLPNITPEYQFIVKEDEEDYNNDYLQVNNYYNSANNNETVLLKAQRTQEKLELLNRVNAMENVQQQQQKHNNNNLENPTQPESSTSTFFTTNHVPLPELHMTNIITNNNIYTPQPYSEIIGQKQISDNVAMVVPPPPQLIPQNNTNNVQANIKINNISYGEPQRNVEMQQHAPPVEYQPQTVDQFTSQQVTLTPLVCPLQNLDDHEGYNQQQNSDLYKQYSHTSMFSPMYMSNTSSAMLYNYNDLEVNKFSSYRDNCRSNNNNNNNSNYNNYNTNDNNSSSYCYMGSNEGMNTSYHQYSPHNTFSVNNTEINSKRSRLEPHANSFSHQYSYVYSYSMPTSSQMACLNNAESNTTSSTTTTTTKATTAVASFPFSQIEDAQLWQYYEPLSRSANGVQNAITTILEDLTTCRHDAARSNRLRELLRYFNNLQNTDFANNASASANTTLEATKQTAKKIIYN